MPDKPNKPKIVQDSLDKERKRAKLRRQKKLDYLKRRKEMGV